MTVTKADVERVVRGPADLEEQIHQLKKQVEFLQGKCRQAGAAILDQELRIKTLTKEIDRLSEENFNLSLVGGKKNDKK
jgi:peptidoglycan hydrolase CwlO-like protein